MPAEAYQKMPLVIGTDDPLYHVGEKELWQALRTARENSWVADWLFSDNARPFHSQVSVPPESFDNALAIHLHHDISTPDQCAPPDPYQRVSPPVTSEKKLVVSKDIDLLLVPFARMDGVTVGYTFIRGIREDPMRDSLSPSFGPPTAPGIEFGAPMFIPGRFTFHNERRDYLMVVNGMSPHMTGLVSMRWRTETARDRCFFAIPKSDYGANNLPSRVLTVQCNVDYAANANVDVPHSECTQQMNSEHTFDSRPEVNAAQTHLPTHPPKPMQFDFGLNSSAEPVAQAKEQEVPDPFFKFDTTLDNTWAQGLETIGTIIPPGDANGLPELMQDIFPNTSLEDMEQLFNNANNAWSNETPFPFSDEQANSLSPAISSLTSSSRSTEADQVSGSLPPSVPENDQRSSSWLVSNQMGGTPDGVGVPRRPGGNDTSSGAFNMSALFDSLQRIEKSMKGNFFSPKVRKDIMHPLTGELLSRSTGQLTGKVDSIDAFSLKLFREVAAQSYYATVMAMSSDSRLLTMVQPISPSPPISNGRAYAEHNQIRKRPVFKRVAPAPLAPRPVPIVAAPVVTKQNEEVTEQSKEEAVRQAKLEAKRIKNRMSAARSNQKRRAQLEAQREELAMLRRRVEELTNKKQLALEENRVLRRQVQKS
ncbi:hypothetical protein FGB62_104g120 [Gracilaria domingensis]|nr:hypothetical protein FGB62_104g120 [Gracilaria domingensis]